MRESSLLNRQKWADLVSARTDDANRSGDDQPKEIFCYREHQTRRGHQQRAHNEHPPAANAIRLRGQKKGNHGIAGESQGEQQARLGLAQSDPDQIENQYDGNQSVSEKAREAREEQQPSIAR